jgi:hypothetical protein
MDARKNNPYIIRSGCGYFVDFVSGSPQMCSDPVEATRLTEDEANETKLQLSICGFGADLVAMRYGRISKEEASYYEQSA